MDQRYGDRMLSIVRGGRDGWNERYDAISEFKDHLKEGDGSLADEGFRWGYVLWSKENGREQQQQIVSLLKSIADEYNSSGHYVVQFWGVEKVGGGRHHHLSSSHLPFCVGYSLNKGLCWYREMCFDHVCVVDTEGDEGQQLIGGVGRAYLSKQPESSPDLRLYSPTEFPMRDEVASCGFRGYMALPLFDIRTKQCCGVLELLSNETMMDTYLFSALDEGLEVAGLRSTHRSIYLRSFERKMSDEYEQKLEVEIKEILKFCMLSVPRLYLAQVWVPCYDCVNFHTDANNNVGCMELEAFIDSENKIVNSSEETDVHEYLEACGFHNLQVDFISSSHLRLCDISISKNSLAHYAQKARIVSHPFPISLESVNNSNLVYLVQFFFLLLPKSREVAYDDYAVHLLLRIMQRNLKSFKFVPGGQLQEQYLIRSREAFAVDQCEPIDSLDVVRSYKQKISEANFITYLETSTLCYQRPHPLYFRRGWIFLCPLVEPVMITENIVRLMQNLAVKVWSPTEYWIVQFWAPKLVEERCYLQSVDQPYAFGILTNGIASFRKKCLKHYYPVDDQAKEDELGPPGRVFRNGHPEYTPDLLYYSIKEFSIKNYAIHCCSPRGYFALPIFDVELNQKCVGVLEFIGFKCANIGEIGKQLEVAGLRSTCPDFYPKSSKVPSPVSTLDSRQGAQTEVYHFLVLIRDSIPQLHTANVWIPNGESITNSNSNESCMLLALSTNFFYFHMVKDQLHSIRIQNRKGMFGMLLASEDKSCFCRNLSEFSIADQPQSHLDLVDRSDVCFAICLQSSHTGDLIYVFEFLLCQGPATYEYVRSFLNFLIPAMKHEFVSFKLASGKQLGEELVVDVIEFSDADKLHSSESQNSDVFPIKFQSVRYGLKEHQHTGEQTGETCSIATSCSNTREKGKKKAGSSLSLQVLESHFGKKLKDVAEELGIGRSTIKRACRGYGIARWPTNTSLLERECVEASQEDMLPSTSSQQPLNASPHMNVPHTITEEKAIIKVKYVGDFIKFELHHSLGLAKLKQEVATRLNLEMGSFKLKYKDEDGDEILLTNDDDLQLCRKSQIATDQAYIQLFVR